MLPRPPLCLSRSLGSVPPYLPSPSPVVFPPAEGINHGLARSFEPRDRFAGVSTAEFHGCEGRSLFLRLRFTCDFTDFFERQRDREREEERKLSSLDSLPPSFFFIQHATRIRKFRSIALVEKIRKTILGIRVEVEGGKVLRMEFHEKNKFGPKKKGLDFLLITRKFRDRSSIHEFLHVASNICAHLGRKEIDACFFFFSRQDNRDMSVWCVELRHQRRYLRSRLGKRRTNVARKQRSGSRERVADPSILRLIGS